MGQEILAASLRGDASACSIGEVLLFSPTESPPYFQTECCPAGKDFCSGCAKLNGGKTACEKCSGGFTQISGKCIACVDLPGWVNSVSQGCMTASCSAEKFQGYSSEAACCKCGGQCLQFLHRANPKISLLSLKPVIPIPDFNSRPEALKPGGQKAATSFAYYVGPLAIGSTGVQGYPVPQTASSYSVDKDCELAKYLGPCSVKSQQQKQ